MILEMPLELELSIDPSSGWVRYPSYQDTGIQWINEVPSHWRMWKISHAFRGIGSGTTPATDQTAYFDGDIPWITTSELREKVIVDTKKKLSDEALRDHSALTMFPAGSLLIAMYGATIGRLGILGLAACTNQACCVLSEPKSLDVRFTFYWLWAFRPIIILQASGGGQPNINQDTVRSIRIPAPPLDEQCAIAGFLDRETAKIDVLVAKKERLIELLQEKRAALISHTVTRGLDPDAPMKDSGVEWLGGIPAHWDTYRMKLLCAEPMQYGANEAAQLLDPHLPRYIRITDIEENGRLRDDTFRSLPEDIAKPYLLRSGDLLFARSGATVGKTFMYRDDWGTACYAGYLIRVRPNRSRTYPEFIAYFARSLNYWGWISENQIQATIQNVNAEKYGNLVLAVPSLDEQKSIIDYLDTESSRIDSLIAKILEHIDRLYEYRTALISAAVTGKIDVRGEVIAP